MATHTLCWRSSGVRGVNAKYGSSVGMSSAALLPSLVRGLAVSNGAASAAAHEKVQG